jgi:hypothetical protein
MKRENSDKKDLLEKYTPVAFLRADNLETANVIPCLSTRCEVIHIYDFTFFIGRESRVRQVDKEVVVLGRKESLDSVPTNDIYLIDLKEYLQISREHFQIEKQSDGYYIVDRGSHCGTYVNENRLYGDGKQVREKLNDGDIIKLGTKESPYRFEFIVL